MNLRVVRLILLLEFRVLSNTMPSLLILLWSHNALAAQFGDLSHSFLCETVWILWPRKTSWTLLLIFFSVTESQPIKVLTTQKPSIIFKKRPPYKWRSIWIRYLICVCISILKLIFDCNDIIQNQRTYQCNISWFWYRFHSIFINFSVWTFFAQCGKRCKIRNNV